MAKEDQGIPKAFREFSARFPRIAEAWEILSGAGAQGPLDEKTRRFVMMMVRIG